MAGRSWSGIAATYYVHGEKPLEALKEGRLHIVLEGKKLKGDWALIRTRSDGGKNQWLLLKSDADVKPVSKKRDDESAKTGRTMKQIAKDRDAEWQSHRADEASAAGITARAGSESRRAKPSGHKKKVSRAPSIKDGRLALADSLPAAKPRFIAADETKAGRDAANGRGLDLRAEV